MEQHPVPQNVTTFQFRLIGDMTLKQFGYLAGGAILAFISYKLPLPFFFRWPLTFAFAFGGFGFAFVPIEERPMDVWVLSFLRNVYSPTLFVWQRSAPTEEPTATPPAPVQTKTAPTAATPAAVAVHPPAAATATPTSTPAATAVPAAPTAKPVADTVSGLYTPVIVPGAPAAPPAHVYPQIQKRKSPVDALFSWIDNLFAPPRQYAPTGAVHMPQAPSVTGVRVAPQPTVQAPQPPRPTVAPQTQQPAPPRPVTPVMTPPPPAAPLTPTPAPAPKPEESKVTALQQQMEEMQKTKEAMEREIAMLRQQAAPKPAPAPTTATRAAGVVAAAPKGPTVKIITPETAVKSGLPKLTSFPNVVTGIIKDNENVLLPGILVTVRDKDGIPLRALKTNKLGQFAASTPLPNGTYVIEVEDPRERFVFDRVQVTLNGSVVPAVEVVAKSKREIDREKLSREIFGQPNM